MKINDIVSRNDNDKLYDYNNRSLQPGHVTMATRHLDVELLAY